MQLLLRNYMDKDFDEDAFAAFCKLHLQLSVRYTLYVAIRAKKTGTRILEELAIYGNLSMLMDE